MNLRRSFYFLMVALGLATLSPAAVEVRFFALEDLPSSLFLKDGARLIPVDLPVLALSARHSLESAPVVELYDGKPTAERPGPAARIALPAGATQLLIVLGRTPSAAAEDALLFSGTAFAEDEASYPDGSLRVLNLTGASLAVDVAGEQGVLAPGQIRLMQPQPDAKRRVRVRAAYQRDGSWNLLNKGLFALMPSTRATCIAVYSATGMAHAVPVEQREASLSRPGLHWLTFTDSAPAAAPGQRRLQ